MAKTHEELSAQLGKWLSEKNVEAKMELNGAKEVLDSVDTVLDLFLKKVNEVEDGDVFTITSVSEELMEHRELLMVKVPTDFDTGFEATIERNANIDTSPIYGFRVYTEKYMYSMSVYDGTYKVDAVPLEGVKLNVGQIGSK